LLVAQQIPKVQTDYNRKKQLDDHQNDADIHETTS
jgi:hypothetical protein